MTKPKKERVNLTMNAAQKRSLQRGKPSHYPFTTWVKDLALLAARNFELLGGTQSVLELRKVTTPSPARPRVDPPDPDQDQESVYNYSSRARPGKPSEPRITPPPPPKMLGHQPATINAEAFTAELVEVLNRLAGTRHPPDAPNSHRVVYGRLSGTTDGKAATPEQMRRVVEHCATTWSDKYRRTITLSTLLGRKFWDYLGNAEAATEGPPTSEPPLSPAAAAARERELERQRADDNRRRQTSREQSGALVQIAGELGKVIEAARLATEGKADE